MQGSIVQKTLKTEDPRKKEVHNKILILPPTSMDTPLDESNLAHIGSDEDKAAREAAASFEVNWEGAGENPGVQIWRVENRRDDNDNPVFGINIWPKTRHGEFYRGDSYIVLQTTKVPDASSLQWDIYL